MLTITMAVKRDCRYKVLCGVLMPKYSPVSESGLGACKAVTCLIISILSPALCASQSGMTIINQLSMQYNPFYHRALRLLSLLSYIHTHAHLLLVFRCVFTCFTFHSRYSTIHCCLLNLHTGEGDFTRQRNISRTSSISARKSSLQPWARKPSVLFTM